MAFVPILMKILKSRLQKMQRLSLASLVTPRKKKNVSNVSTVAIKLSDGQQLEEITVSVRSRTSKRTLVNLAVPSDIIDIKKITTQSGKLEINELLQYVSPSF